MALAAEVILGVDVGGAVGQTEAGAGALVGEDVPPGVGVAKQRASDLIPVSLGVGNGRDGLAHLGATDRPATLGHPDLATTSNSHGLLPSLVEESLGVGDVIRHHLLVVRVLINTEPVELLDDIRVGAVNPGIPSVDVTDLGAAQAGARDGLLDLLDVVDQSVGLGTNTSVVLDASHRVAVEILTADGDTNNLLGERVTVLVDGVLEGSNLVGHVVTGSPHTQQETSALRDGSRNGLNGGVGGAALNHGVETSAGEAAVGTDEVLGGFEFGLEISLVHAASISLGRAIVEALVDGLGGRDRKCERGEKLLRKHGVFGNECVCVKKEKESSERREDGGKKEEKVTMKRRGKMEG